MENIKKIPYSEEFKKLIDSVSFTSDGLKKSLKSFKQLYFAYLNWFDETKPSVFQTYNYEIVNSYIIFYSRIALNYMAINHLIIKIKQIEDTKKIDLKDFFFTFNVKLELLKNDIKDLTSFIKLHKMSMPEFLDKFEYEVIKGK